MFNDKGTVLLETIVHKEKHWRYQRGNQKPQVEEERTTQ